MNNKSLGFTLIEILIALTVFAILAGISASALYYSFNTQSRVKEQTERLITLQMTISLLEVDAIQTIGRAVRGNDMRLFPPFIGQSHYMEWTRMGKTNPESYAKQSTLQRVAWLCEQQQLLRRSWDSLDSIDRNRFHDKILLTNLKHCEFHFLNQNLQVLSDWRANALSQDQTEFALPKALQVSLTLNDWGNADFLFPLPKAIYYAKTQ